MIGCSLLVHRCCFVKIDFSRFFSSKYLWFFHTLPERCCDTMVFIHPTGPVCTHFFGPVFSHPFGRIDIRTCFQPEVEKRICTVYTPQKIYKHRRAFYWKSRNLYLEYHSICVTYILVILTSIQG